MPAAIVIVLMGVLLMSSAMQRSPAVDERFHTVRGLAFWWEGDTRMSYAHPPLANALTAAPAALFLPRSTFNDLPAWKQNDSRDLGREWFMRDYPAARRALMWCRGTMGVLTLCFAAYLYLACASFFGRRVAFCALVLFAFNPTVLAHGGLMTTDLPATFGIFAMVVELLRYLRDGRYRNLVVFGLVCGAATMTKFTGLGVFLIVLVLQVGFALFGKDYVGRRGRRRFLRLFSDLAIVGALVLFVVNASYRFERTGYTVRELVSKKDHREQGRPQIEPGPLKDLPKQLRVPVPYTLVYGLHTFTRHETHGHASWYWGKAGKGGWPSYFPVLLSIKTPVPVLLMLLAALVVGLAPPRRPERPLLSMLLVSAAFLVVIVRSGLNIGVRHALPIVPFLSVFAGVGASALYARAGVGRWPRLLRYAPVLCLAVMPIVPLTTFPDYLGYFNAVVGRKSGHRVSIVGEDWGQDAIDLAKVAKERGWAPFYYAPYVHTSLADLRLFGVNAKKLYCEEPVPQKAWVAVHVSTVRRRPQCFPWLKQANLEVTINDHIRVYHYDPEAAKKPREKAK